MRRNTMNWEMVYKISIATIGGALGYLFGGWSDLIIVLFIFGIIDYGSGMVASWFEGKLNSKIGSRGIAKKIMMFAIVAVANLLDQILPLGPLAGHHVIREATIFFYLGNELLSIIENAGRMGLPLPSQLTNAVSVLKGKSEEGK